MFYSVTWKGQKGDRAVGVTTMKRLFLKVMGAVKTISLDWFVISVYIFGVEFPFFPYIPPFSSVRQNRSVGKQSAFVCIWVKKINEWPAWSIIVEEEGGASFFTLPPPSSNSLLNRQSVKLVSSYCFRWKRNFALKVAPISKNRCYAPVGPFIWATLIFLCSYWLYPKNKATLWSQTFDFLSVEPCFMPLWVTFVT